jgi:hypothetical protein
MSTQTEGNRRADMPHPREITEPGRTGRRENLVHLHPGNGPSAARDAARIQVVGRLVTRESDGITWKEWEPRR